MTRVSVIAYNFVLMCTNNVKIKNLELHHRFEHDLRQNELGSVLAVDVANDLPAVEALLLQRNTRTSRLGALPQNRFTIYVTTGLCPGMLARLEAQGQGPEQKLAPLPMSRTSILVKHI